MEEWVERAAGNLQRFNGRIDAMLEPQRRAEEGAARAAGNLQRFNGRIDAMLEPQRRAEEGAARAARNLQGFAGPIASTFQIIGEFPEQLAVVRQRDKKSLQLLAKLGWWVDPHMPFIPLALLEKMLSDYPEYFVSNLVRFFRKRLDDIEQELKEAYPHRSHLFKDAFDAHRAGKYSLSIPVFLTQADGIWQERFSVNLFIRGGRERTVEKHIASFENISFAVLMHPFSISTTPLWVPQGKRNASFDEFNRHQVLHGDSVNYGTEENSLKAISLLSNLRYLLEQTNPIRN